MIDTGLKDKVVLVTGAQHGIGAATAKALPQTEHTTSLVKFPMAPANLPRSLTAAARP